MDGQKRKTRGFVCKNHKPSKPAPKKIKQPALKTKGKNSQKPHLKKNARKVILKNRETDPDNLSCSLYLFETHYHPDMKYIIKKNEISIGSNKSCDIYFKNIRGLADKHCILSIDVEGKASIDPVYKHGLTYLNGEIIQERMNLKDDDIIIAVKETLKFSYDPKSKWSKKALPLTEKKKRVIKMPEDSARYLEMESVPGQNKIKYNESISIIKMLSNDITMINNTQKTIKEVEDLLERTEEDYKNFEDIYIMWKDLIDKVEPGSFNPETGEELDYGRFGRSVGPERLEKILKGFDETEDEYILLLTDTIADDLDLELNDCLMSFYLCQNAIIKLSLAIGPLQKVYMKISERQESLYPAILIQATPGQKAMIKNAQNCQNNIRKAIDHFDALQEKCTFPPFRYFHIHSLVREKIEQMKAAGINTEKDWDSDTFDGTFIGRLFDWF